MYNTLQAPALIPSTWIVDALVTVRDRLLSLDADALVDARDVLALTVSECVGGLKARDASNTPGDDYEDLDPESSDPEWPVWTDRETWTLGEPDADEPTPLDLLAAGVPVSGGAPFEPSEADWDDYFSARDATDDGRLTDADIVTVQGCC